MKKYVWAALFALAVFAAGCERGPVETNNAADAVRSGLSAAETARLAEVARLLDNPVPLASGYPITVTAGTVTYSPGTNEWTVVVDFAIPYVPANIGSFGNYVRLVPEHNEASRYIHLTANTQSAVQILGEYPHPVSPLTEARVTWRFPKYNKPVLPAGYPEGLQIIIGAGYQLGTSLPVDLSGALWIGGQAKPFALANVVVGVN